jgi:hypothetical protein
MPPSSAVVNASYLPTIGFPEFTAKLITDTFDALVAANIRQMEAYVDLLKNVAKTMTAFINDCKGEIDGVTVAGFLSSNLPANVTDNIGKGTTVAIGGNADAISSLLSYEGKTVTINAGDTYNAKKDEILNAAAEKICSGKYEALVKMVKMGVLRLVVENGVIETRLTFTTYQSDIVQNSSNSYNSSSFSTKASAGTGFFTSLFAKASASTSYNAFGVRTTQHTDKSVDGSNVQISGRVQINFKTDYQPLNQLVQ